MSQDSTQSQAPLYFDCHMCGECCSSWNIPIETEKAKLLLEKPWVQARLKETRRQLTPMTIETYRIPLTDENVCVFLAKDRRCMVEAQEGLALKPHECQRFPFATVRLPDGTDWHETSAACKSISEKLLLAFQPIQPKPEPSKPCLSTLGMEHDSSMDPKRLATDLAGAQARLSASLEPMALLPARIPLSGFRSVSATQYGHYQQGLKTIFQSELHPEAALVQAAACLRQCVTPSDPNTRHVEGSSIEPMSNQPARCFPKILSWVLTVYFLRKPYRTLSGVQLLLGLNYPDPRIFGEPISLQTQSRLPWNPQLNLHLNAFLFNLLQRKRLLALGSSLATQLAMAGVACLLVQWYARTLAVLGGIDTINQKELATAIRLVERYYTGHQPRFLRWFSSRWQGELIANLLFPAFRGG